MGKDGMGSSIWTSPLVRKEGKTPWKIKSFVSSFRAAAWSVLPLFRPLEKRIKIFFGGIPRTRRNISITINPWSGSQLHFPSNSHFGKFSPFFEPVSLRHFSSFLFRQSVRLLSFSFGRGDRDPVIWADNDQHSSLSM